MVVEIKKDGIEEKIMFVFVKGGIDLWVFIVDRFIVLGVVCEYRNKNFIKYLLKNYFELVGVVMIELCKVVYEIYDEYIYFEI